MLTGRSMFAVCLTFVCLGSATFAEPPKPKDGPLGLKFVPLPKGTTYLGWSGVKGSAKKTEIKEGFEIAVHTVTQGQWLELMGKNPSLMQHRIKMFKISVEELPQFPVEQVSWKDAQEFIKKLNETEKDKGYVYRLPAEAEWEYACRGGATTEQECSYHFYFEKPTNDLSSQQANFDGNFPSGKGEKGPFLQRTAKVGSYPPNKLGLYDMHGNVVQWTDNLWEEKGPGGPRRLLGLRGGPLPGAFPPRERAGLQGPQPRLPAGSSCRSVKVERMNDGQNSTHHPCHRRNAARQPLAQYARPHRRTSRSFR